LMLRETIELRERERDYGKWCWERGESRCQRCLEDLVFRSATWLFESQELKIAKRERRRRRRRRRRERWQVNKGFWCGWGKEGSWIIYFYLFLLLFLLLIFFFTNTRKIFVYIIICLVRIPVTKKKEEVVDIR